MRVWGRCSVRSHLLSPARPIVKAAGELRAEVIGMSTQGASADTGDSAVSASLVGYFEAFSAEATLADEELEAGGRPPDRASVGVHAAAWAGVLAEVDCLGARRRVLLVGQICSIATSRRTPM